MEKRILIITGSMVQRTPHVQMYMNLLDKIGVLYDVVVWNRKSDSVEDLPRHFIVYNKPTDDLYPFWKKIIENWRFSRFIKNHLDLKKYSAAIVVDIAAAVFFSRTLLCNFSNRYIFDIRDYSPLCGFAITRKLIRKLITSSFKTVISSAGFKFWLPKREGYVISHNIDYDTLTSLYNSSFTNISESQIVILTIGNLRDPDAHKEVINAFGSIANFQLYFVGDGLAAPILEDYCHQHNVDNVIFLGHYEKKDEISFYKKADIVNCCMEDNTMSNFLMSNRIYLAALTHKPIICFRGSYQSKIIEEYGIGLGINRNDDMRACTKQYLLALNRDTYEQNRTRFLSMVKNEYELFIGILNELTHF